MLFLIGESQAQPAPDTTCVKQPPTGSSWSVEIVYQSDAIKEKESKSPTEKKDGGEEHKPTKLWVKTGRNGITKCEVFYDDGNKEESFVAKGMLFVKAGNSGKIYTVPARPDDLFSLKTGFFPGTAWITPDYEKESEKKNERECRHYVYSEMIGDVPRPNMKLEAWIRKDTRYPLEVQLGTEEGATIYRFSDVIPYSEDVLLPKELQETMTQKQAARLALDKIRKANKAASGGR